MGRTKHALLDAHQIVPNLWQGSKPPLGSRVAQAGFKCLVLCAREIQPPVTSFPGVRVVHAPNDDSVQLPLTRDKLAVALAAARTVALAVSQGDNCLVTCAAGMNRSGLVSALALHLLYGWPGGRCIQRVRDKRGPHHTFTPLSNPEFVQALQKLPAKGMAVASKVPPRGWQRTAAGILIPS